MARQAIGVKAAGKFVGGAGEEGGGGGKAGERLVEAERYGAGAVAGGARHIMAAGAAVGGAYEALVCVLVHINRVLHVSLCKYMYFSYADRTRLVLVLWVLSLLLSFFFTVLPLFSAVTFFIFSAVVPQFCCFFL